MLRLQQELKEECYELPLQIRIIPSIIQPTLKLYTYFPVGDASGYPNTEEQNAIGGRPRDNTGGILFNYHQRSSVCIYSRHFRKC
jgi:hypothetical protein